MEVPETLKPKPASPLEVAKREYHLATVAMGELDAKVIDAAATLDELREAYGKSITRVNQAREALIEARTPPPASETADAPREGLRAVECGQPVPAANGHAEDFEPPPAAA